MVVQLIHCFPTLTTPDGQVLWSGTVNAALLVQTHRKMLVLLIMVTCDSILVVSFINPLKTLIMIDSGLMLTPNRLGGNNSGSN